MVAALYVETGGVYYGLPDVDPWDEERDARLYAGPWPVVAHPPCQRWCRLAKLVEHVHGYKAGEDGGCFVAALAAVRRYGGVLEHPAYSDAWGAFDLPIPHGRGGWVQRLDDPGCAAELDQAAYGHAARKTTWLYAVGCELPELRWTQTRGVSQVSSFRSNRHDGRPWNDRHLDHGRSSYTPPAFQDVLLTMARSVSGPTPQAPSRLATEGRALPYMGRRRSRQETNAAG